MRAANGQGRAADNGVDLQRFAYTETFENGVYTLTTDKVVENSTDYAIRLQGQNFTLVGSNGDDKFIFANAEPKVTTKYTVGNTVLTVGQNTITFNGYVHVENRIVNGVGLETIDGLNVNVGETGNGYYEISSAADLVALANYVNAGHNCAGNSAAHSTATATSARRATSLRLADDTSTATSARRIFTTPSHCPPKWKSSTTRSTTAIHIQSTAPLTTSAARHLL